MRADPPDVTSRSVRQAAFGTFVDLGLVGAAVITVPRLVGTTTTGSEVLAAQVLVVLAAAALLAFPIVAIKLWLLERTWRQGGGVRRAVTCLVQVTGYVGLWSASVLVETAATRVTLWG